MKGFRQQFPAATRLVVPFAAGMLLCCSLPFQIPVEGWGTACFVFVLVSLFAVRQSLLRGILFCLSSLSLGAMLMSNALSQRSIDTGGRRVDYRAVVVSKPEVRGRTLRFDALVVGVKGSSVKPFKAKMAVADTTVAIGIGNGLSCTSAFRKLRNYRGSTFNYARYLFTQGFKAEAFVYATNIKKCNTHLSSLSRLDHLRLRLLLFRSRLVESLSAMDFEGDNLAVVSAMTLGDKTMLNRKLRDVYSISGASHVLALSGLHLGIIYSLLLLLFSRFNRLWRWQLAVRGFVVCSVWSYVLFVGMPLSAVRSAIMLSVCAVVAVSNRGAVTFGSLAVAAVVVLAVSPLSLFDVGFQLSFAAVASILVFSKPIYSLMSCKSVERFALLKWCCGMIAVSLASQIGTAPLAAYYFGRFPLMFLLTNFVAVPLAVVLLYGGVLLAVSAVLPAVQPVVAGMLNNVAGWLNHTLSLLASVPGASVEGIHMSLLQLISTYLLVAALGVIFLRFSKCRRKNQL